MENKTTTLKIKSNPLLKETPKKVKKQSTSKSQKSYAALKKECRELFKDYCNLGLDHEKLKFQVDALKGIFCKELNFLLDAPLWVRLIRIFNKKYLPKRLFEQVFLMNATAFREEVKKRFETKQ